MNRLQKGLQKKTLDIIHAVLKNHAHEFMTCEHIALEVKLSKVAVRHYLNYLIEHHEVVSRINYATGEHPSIEYSGNTRT